MVVDNGDNRSDEITADRKVIETDVLIVGSEGADSRAAIEVAKSGLKVLIATKGVFTKGGATLTADMDIDMPGKDAKEMFVLDGDERDAVEDFAQDMFLKMQADLGGGNTWGLINSGPENYNSIEPGINTGYGCYQRESDCLLTEDGLEILSEIDPALRLIPA